MHHRRRSFVAFLFMGSAVLGFGYGYYLYNELFQKLVVSESIVERTHQQQLVLKDQMNVVYGHVSKLQGSLKKERQGHKSTKLELLTKTKDFQANLTKSKHEARNRFNALDTEYKMLKAQHDETKDNYDALHDQYVRLSQDHKKMIDEHTSSYEALKSSKDKESKSLQDRVQELYNLNIYYKQDATQKEEAHALSQKEVEKLVKRVSEYQDSGKVYESKLTDMKVQLQQCSYKIDILEHDKKIAEGKVLSLTQKVNEISKKKQSIPQAPAHATTKTELLPTQNNVKRDIPAQKETDNLGGALIADNVTKKDVKPQPESILHRVPRRYQTTKESHVEEGNKETQINMKNIALEDTKDQPNIAALRKLEPKLQTSSSPINNEGQLLPQKVAKVSKSDDEVKEAHDEAPKPDQPKPLQPVIAQSENDSSKDKASMIKPIAGPTGKKETKSDAPRVLDASPVSHVPPVEKHAEQPQVDNQQRNQVRPPQWIKDTPDIVHEEGRKQILPPISNIERHASPNVPVNKNVPPSNEEKVDVQKSSTVSLQQGMMEQDRFEDAVAAKNEEIRNAGLVEPAADNHEKALETPRPLVIQPVPEANDNVQDSLAKPEADLEKIDNEDGTHEEDQDEEDKGQGDGGNGIDGDFEFKEDEKKQSKDSNKDATQLDDKEMGNEDEHGDQNLDTQLIASEANLNPMGQGPLHPPLRQQQMDKAVQNEQRQLKAPVKQPRPFIEQRGNQLQRPVANEPEKNLDRVIL